MAGNCLEIESSTSRDKSSTSDILRGIKAATPIVTGYIPIAIAFGILAS